MKYFGRIIIAAMTCAWISSVFAQTQFSLPNNFSRIDFCRGCPKLILSPCTYQRVFRKKLLHPLVGPTAPSIFAPVAYGAEQGTVVAGLGVVNRWPGNNAADGYAFGGLGLGDADRFVALQSVVVLDDLGFRDDPFGHNGTVAFQLWRWLSSSTAVAIGSGNAIPWGNSSFKNKNPSFYGVATQIFNLRPNQPCNPLPLTASLGYGSGAFVNNSTFNNTGSSKGAIFASLGLRVIPKLSVIADWTQNVLSSGVSFLPFNSLPLVVTAYATNLAGSNRASGPVTYGIVAGMGFQLF